jgi:hypothetical protein
MKRVLFGLGLLSTASFSLAQYQFHELAAPAAFRKLSVQGLTATSSRGLYAIGYGTDVSGATHYLLYGPDYSKPPQDLSLGAGPYPLATTPWSGIYTAVNDKGHAVAYSQFDSLTAASVYLYQHEQHLLTEVPLPAHLPANTLFAAPSGVNALTINNGDRIAGDIALGGDQNGNHPVLTPFRWTASGNFMDAPFVHAGYSITMHALSTNDFMVGVTNPNAIYAGAVLGYLSSGETETFSDTSGGYPEGLDPFDVNDFDYVCGVAYGFANAYRSAFVETGWVSGTPEEFVLGAINSGGNTNALCLDNFGRVLGVEDDTAIGGARYPVLWQQYGQGQVPVPVSSLVPVGVAPSATFWWFQSMDHAGNIWGYYDDSLGSVHLFYLSPN